MGQLGKGRCSCGSGLKFKKCCGQAPPKMNEVSQLTEAHVELFVADLIKDFAKPFASEIHATTVLNPTEIILKLSFKEYMMEVKVGRTQSESQARAFVAAHLYKLALRSGIEAPEESPS